MEAFLCGRPVMPCNEAACWQRCDSEVVISSMPVSRGQAAAHATARVELLRWKDRSAQVARLRKASINLAPAPQ